MKANIKYLLGLSALSMLIISACVKEKYDMNTMVQGGVWQPDLAMPLVHSILSVEDILTSAENAEDALGVDSDGLMELIYNDTLFSKKASDFVNFFGAPILIDYTGGGMVSLNIDTIDLNLEVYNNVLGGAFTFEDPTLSIIVTNSIGIPINMTLSTLEAWSPVNGTLPIELWTSQPPIALSPAPNYPTIPGDTAVTIYSFDRNNSNLDAFLQIAPKFIFYSVDGIMGTTTPNFITDSSSFSVEVEVKLPLHGTANFVTLGDTVAFSMNLNDPDGSDVVVNEATFVINTYNRFPADVEMQLLFADSTGAIIDSVFTNGQVFIINGAAVGPAPSLRTSQPRHKATEVLIGRAKLDNLSKANKMIIRGRVTTNNGGATVVKVYQDYTIEVKLAVRAKLQIGG